jgi:hypothetical protein
VEDKISSEAMNRLEDRKEILSSLLLTRIDSNGNRIPIYNTFMEEARAFFISHQDILIKYPKPYTLVKISYLKLLIQNSTSNRIDIAEISSA